MHSKPDDGRDRSRAHRQPDITPCPEPVSRFQQAATRREVNHVGTPATHHDGDEGQGRNRASGRQDVTTSEKSCRKIPHVGNGDRIADGERFGTSDAADERENRHPGRQSCRHTRNAVLYHRAAVR